MTDSLDSDMSHVTPFDAYGDDATTLVLAAFMDRIGRRACDFYDNPERLELSFEPEHTIYRHAVYINNVIDRITSIDVSNYGFDAACMFNDSRELEYVQSSGRSTVWRRGSSDAGVGNFVVRQNEDGSMTFYHATMKAEQIGKFNADRKSLYVSRNKRIIADAAKVVRDSAPEHIDNALRRYYDDFAEKAGIPAAPSVYYSYRGHVPLGRTWGRAEIAFNRDSDPIVKKEFDLIVKHLTEKYGDDDLMHGWVTQVDSHWAVGWIEYVAIQFFFDEDDLSSLTPIALDYFDITNNRAHWLDRAIEEADYDPDYDEDDEGDEVYSDDYEDDDDLGISFPENALDGESLERIGRILDQLKDVVKGLDVDIEDEQAGYNRIDDENFGDDPDDGSMLTPVY